MLSIDAKYIDNKNIDSEAIDNKSIDTHDGNTRFLSLYRNIY